MRVWKRLLIFGGIALAMQLGILLYFNNSYLKSFTAFKPSNTPVVEQKKPASGILMPEGIEGIQASFDGRYSSYYKDNSIYVIDNQTGVRTKVPLDDGQSLNFYKWHDRKNELIIGEHGIVNGASKLKLTVYKAETARHELIKDLSWIGKNIKLGNLEFAGESDYIVTLIQSNGKMELYYVGREVSKIPVNSTNLGIFKYTGKDKNVLYQDKSSNKFYITGNKKPFELKSPASKILDIDMNGNIYTAELSKNQISAIYYKNINNAGDTWHSIDMKQPVDVSELLLNSRGNIYMNNVLEGKFTDLRNNLTISYQGKYMAFFDGGILILKDNVLDKKNFKEASKS